jgi:hypothetical protein
MRGLMTLAVTAALVAGCATNPAPVRLVADPEGEKALDGVWAGDYNTAAGRAGSITFMLVMHEGVCEICGMTGLHAHGDVLMIPRGMHDALRPVDGEYQSPETGLDPQVLQFEMVHVTGNHISGTIEPYRDPETGHPFSSSFEGTIAGERMSGEFIIINGKTGERDIGTWEAARKKDRP